MFVDAVQEDTDDYYKYDKAGNAADEGDWGRGESHIEYIRRDRPCPLVAVAVDRLYSPVICAGCNADDAACLAHTCFAHDRFDIGEVGVIGYFQCIGDAAWMGNLCPAKGNRLSAKQAEGLPFG